MVIGVIFTALNIGHPSWVGSVLLYVGFRGMVVGFLVLLVGYLAAHKKAEKRKAALFGLSVSFFFF